MDREHQEQPKVSNDFSEYYFLSPIPENHFLIEQKYFKSDRNLQVNFKSDRTNNKSSTSPTEIIIALGFITALLCFAGMQLYRSVNIGSAKVEKQTEKAVNINSIKDLKKITPKQFAWRIY